VQVFVKRNRFTVLVVLVLAISSSLAAQRSSDADEVPPRVSRLDKWLAATAAHRPGAFDDRDRHINSLKQE
jgi:hypothetical protein